ncbi:hypothetical protein ACCD10_00665 [Pseudomonas sp. Pseusp122]|uniref:hypothetical protein n=1 Tax=unclassified Pseudomonas TaxID=196821 RepID=UPI0039A55B97
MTNTARMASTHFTVLDNIGGRGFGVENFKASSPSAQRGQGMLSMKTVDPH